MSKYLILQKADNSNATLLISANSPEVWDYINSGFKKQHEGTKSACMDWLDNYWYESEIPEDERIFLTHKK